MAPLILHNVPDDELYTGEDGVQRPYAMLFPSTDGAPTSRIRRTVPETGSFGKSTRRSRSRTGTPAAKAVRENPTLDAAEAIFTAHIAKLAVAPSDSQRKSSLATSVSQPNLSASLGANDTNTSSSQRYVHKEPTEVILRGFKSTHQYAAIREYERIGGRICEDYPRDPPLEQRKYKADLRDPALRPMPLTQEEKFKALRFAGGDNWIKITFESGEAAEAAVDASPQFILGYQVYAELYRGMPPSNTEAIPATTQRTPRADRPSSGLRPSSTLPRSFTTPSMSQISRDGNSFSPPDSLTSTHTLDSATISTATASSTTVVGQQRSHDQEQELLFCRRIPTAKRAQLLPAEQALLPQNSYSQRILSSIPIIGWLSSDIIGSTVPKTEAGDFDWAKASLYWKLVYWVDSITGWFDIANGDKDD